MIESVIRYANKDIWISFYDATIIHANKYAQASGGWGSLPVSSTLFTDVVFRLKEGASDISLTIVDVDLPVYTQQEVTLISANRNIIGYIDSKTQYYYYTTKNFSRLFKLGMPYYFVWLGTALGFILSYWLDRDNAPVWTIIAFGVAYAIYHAQKAFFNFRVKKEIDQFLQ